MNMAIPRSAGTSADTSPTATLAELGPWSDPATRTRASTICGTCLSGRHRLPQVREATRFHRVRGRSAYACQYCGYHVYPTAGTIFRRSTTSLRSWFRAMHIVGSGPTRSPREISAGAGITRRPPRGCSSASCRSCKPAPSCCSRPRRRSRPSRPAGPSREHGRSTGRTGLPGCRRPTSCAQSCSRASRPAGGPPCRRAQGARRARGGRRAARRRGSHRAALRR